MTNETIIWNPRYAIWIALQEDRETQTELAERLEWEPSKLSRIINGKAKHLDIGDLQQISSAQGRPLSYYTEPPQHKKGDSAHNPRTVLAPWFPRPIDFQAASPILEAA